MTVAVGAAGSDLGGHPVQWPAPPYTLPLTDVTLGQCGTGMIGPVLLRGKGWDGSGRKATDRRREGGEATTCSKMTAVMLACRKICFSRVVGAWHST